MTPSAATPPVAGPPSGTLRWSASCRALVLDLDGTMVDSSVAILRSWRAWCEELGVSAERVAEVVVGRSAADVIRALAPSLSPGEVDRNIRRIFRMQERDPAPAEPLPGAFELVSRLRGDDWAVVTGCSRELARVRLAAGGLPMPPLLVADEDIPVGKPDPSGYLRALRGLGLPPEDVVAIEDAPSGVGAARAAGLRVVAVTTTNPPGALSGADVIVGGLAELSVVPAAGGRGMVLSTHSPGQVPSLAAYR